MGAERLFRRPVLTTGTDTGTIKAREGDTRMTGESLVGGREMKGEVDGMMIAIATGIEIGTVTGTARGMVDGSGTTNGEEGGKGVDLRPGIGMSSEIDGGDNDSCRLWLTKREIIVITSLVVGGSMNTYSHKGTCFGSDNTHASMAPERSKIIMVYSTVPFNETCADRAKRVIVTQR